MVVSIRQSDVLTKVEKDWSSPFPCIAIEDPFDLSKNHGAGLSEDSESQTSDSPPPYLTIYFHLQCIATSRKLSLKPGTSSGLLRTRAPDCRR